MLSALLYSHVPVCGKFEWNGARIETQAGRGWVVDMLKVDCVGRGLWAEEGKCNILVIAEQLHVLLL